MIIAISGRTASGKTTLANALAEAVDGVAASFGDHVRMLALKLGRPTDRATLQELGQAAVEADPSSFAHQVLSAVEVPASEIIVLEGLRHVAIRDALCAYAGSIGSPIRFIHIETEDAARAARLDARGENPSATARHDAHATESDVRDRLRDEADCVVHRSDDISIMVAAVVRELGLGPVAC